MQTQHPLGGAADTPVATPTAFPDLGTFGVTQRITFLCATPGATIHYTTDGSEPTAYSPVFDPYVLPVLEAINDGDQGITSTYTVKAIALKDGMLASDVATFSYTIERKDVYLTRTMHPGIHMTHDQNPTPGTIAVWAGELEQERWHGSTQTPIALGVASGYATVDAWLDVATGQAPGYIYNRNTNPTVQVFEEKVRQLEGAAAATSFASGMAAISNTLWALLRPGDRVVSVKDSYGGTSKLFLEILPRFNISCILCDTTDTAALEAEIAQGCRVLYLETPTNPTLKIIDIARLAKAARRVGATVVVDNTFATPLNQRPLELGADLVVHSATKFLGGHADALGGVLCGDAELVGQVYHYREITGAALDPHAAYLLLRGLKTLHLRIERQNANALRIARFLESHPAVAAVYYPGLPAHPQHALAATQMRGFGGMLSFTLHGGLEAVKAFLPRMRYAHRAANLGAVETIIGVPATTSHVELTALERATLGIPEGLVRYSAGIEDSEDLLADLTQALDGCSDQS